MTRILVIGNSHAATLRRAFPVVQAARPDLSLSFWGLPGAAFDKASTGPDGRLRPDPKDRTSRRKVGQWNDAPEADLTTPDHIFLVGMRFGLRAALGLMRQLQPLDQGRRLAALGVSDGFLRAAVRATIDASLAGIAARLWPDRRIPDLRIILMPAPYPAVSMGDASIADPPIADPVTAAATGLAHAPALMTLFEAELAQAIAARGLSLALQPRSTLAGAFRTDPRYLDTAAGDARHMNAPYGRLALDALLSALSPPFHHGDHNHALGS